MRDIPQLFFQKIINEGGEVDEYFTYIENNYSSPGNDYIWTIRSTSSI